VSSGGVTLNYTNPAMTPTTPSTPSDTTFNSDGVRVIPSYDSYHAHSLRWYCGRYVGQNGYANACGYCDGRCGPDNGCQCHSCFALNSYRPPSQVDLRACDTRVTPPTNTRDSFSVNIVNGKGEVIAAEEDVFSAVKEVIEHVMVNGELPSWMKEVTPSEGTPGSFDVNVDKLVSTLHTHVYDLLTFSENHEEEGIKLLLLILKMRPNKRSQIVAHFNMACALSRLRRVAESLESLKKALDLARVENLLEKYVSDCQTDKDLIHLQNTPEFQAYIATFSPYPSSSSSLSPAPSPSPARSPAHTHTDSPTPSRPPSTLSTFRDNTRCLKGHPLTLSTVSSGVYQNGFRCDLCDRLWAHGTERWNCLTCTFDVCFVCLPQSGQARKMTVCKKGHSLSLSRYAEGGYTTGYICDLCRRRGSCGVERWFCRACHFDVCLVCQPSYQCFHGHKASIGNDLAPLSWECFVCGKKGDRFGYQWTCTQKCIHVCTTCWPVK
jgi:hypothetical protein